MPHLRDVGRQLGRLRQHGGIHIADLPAVVRQMRRYLLQKAQTVRAPPALVAVGKQPADVAQRRRTQQGVHHRVGQHIRVGMSQQSPLIGDVDAAQYQRPPLCQTVYVVPVSDPYTDH